LAFPPADHSLSVGPGEERLTALVVWQLIGATTTQTGLRVHAELDRGRYPLGTKLRDAELAAVPLARHEFHGEWNYSIQPAADKPPPTAR
jgi:Rhodopirellula transposase DDE domain